MIFFISFIFNSRFDLLYGDFFMLEGITDSLQSVFKSISGKGKLTEANIEKAIAEIRLALLEADVNISIVRDFINHVTEKSLGQKVIANVNPREYFIKVVNDELTEMLGGEASELKLKPKDTLSVILMAGLQGSGKTTTTGKIAKFLKENHGRKVLLAACDVYRPAAIEQLERVGEMAGAEVFAGERKDAIKTAKQAFKKAKTGDYDTLIVDTAGRLHIDKDMMDEVKKIAKALRPDETFFVADSMTGQNAAEIAGEFNEVLEISGVILTKFDSDTRGGAAFSIKKTIEKPIKFVGVGEKLDGLEVFHPDRIASRILGMGDIVSLVEKAEKVYDEKEAERLEQKLRKAEFTLQDFLEQLDQMSKIGSMESIMEMIPGMKQQMQNVNIDEKRIKRQKAIIQSMTLKERNDHTLIVGTRKRRIARGSGVSVLEVDKLLKNFGKSRQMMKKMLKGNKGLPTDMMGMGNNLNMLK